VSRRQWARLNPTAQHKDPLTLADHQKSRYIVEPLRLLDCCGLSNGAVAVVLTTHDRSADLPSTPVFPWGISQAHTGYDWDVRSNFGLRTGAAVAGPKAMRMAGVTPADIDVLELYDCYTYTCLVQLEDYGFCERGEAGELAASGALAPGGTVPTSTGGGQLSGYCLWGMTPLAEAISQLRSEGGERQAARHDVALVSGNGGVLDFHASLILGRKPHE
jgi:acetyl-CoA acetyltransferase